MQILIKEKHAKILIALKNQSQSWYISSLARATNTTYVHTCNFISACEKLNLVYNEKHGKIKTVKLTDKGSKVAELLNSIYNILGEQSIKNKDNDKGISTDEKKNIR
jgi:predicted transcriptional regulator